MNRVYTPAVAIVFLLLSQLVTSCDDPEKDYEAICASLSPTGNGLGDVAENWTLQDADGNSHSLHDYCGKVIYLKVGARW